MSEGFLLPQGIDIDDISALKSAYCREDDSSLSAVLSADKLYGFLEELTALLPEPVFFFLELPCTADEEKALGKSGRYHYKLYYLDNCTAPVIRAILKEYGTLLINDGLCRFGFGGNVSGDEVYIRSYKVTSIYCSGSELYGKAISLLEKYGAEEQAELITPWEVISPENPGVCAAAEEDGITPFDLPELLKDAGMYYADTIE